MKKVSAAIFILISIIIFSTLSSNSYVYFKENQERMFIEDTIIVKAFDGEKYKSVSDMIEMLDTKELDYVIYYVEGQTYYTFVKDYENMLSLELDNEVVIDQKIGNYYYKPLSVDSGAFEVFLAVEGYSEEDLSELFLTDDLTFTDGTIAFFSQGYEGMLSIQVYLIITALMVLISFMYLSLYLQTQKESIGIMKLLGYDTACITKKYVKEIIIAYTLSILFIYVINFNYFNFMLSQRYVFSDLLNLLLLYLISIVLSIFLCGAIIYYYVSKLSAVQFLREVSYD